MNISAHQEQNKNKETKNGKREAGEGRRQETVFKKAVCCPLSVVQGQHAKKWLCKGNAGGNWDPWKGQPVFFCMLMANKDKIYFLLLDLKHNLSFRKRYPN